MSLNYLGLGFSFGVKDLKLKDFQASVSEGFLDMADKAVQAVESVKPFVPSFKAVVPQIDAATDAMGDFESGAIGAIEKAGEALKANKEQWTEMESAVTDVASAVTDAANVWKGEFTQVGEQLRQDVVEGFERATEAARVLYQQTGLDQVSMALTEMQYRAKESGKAIYEAADAAFGISRVIGPIQDAAKGFMGLGTAAEGANRAAMAINPEESVQGVRALDDAVKASTTTFDNDLPVSMEAASRSFHKESTRIIVDSEHMSKMFKKIKEAGDSLKELVGLSKLQTIFQGIGTGLLAQLSRMKTGMGSLLNAQVNLTTSLEAEGVQLAKSARSTAAQMGYTGKEMKKVTAQAAGLASGLNIGADVAVKAIYNFNWAQKEFQALGIKTASQAAKMAESLGLDPSSLAGALRRATQEFGMTADEAAQLASSLHTMGAEGGVATKMVEGLPSVLETLAGATDAAGNLMRGKDLQQFALSTVAAGAGLYTFTQNSEEAMEISKELAKKIIESRVQFQNLMSGVSGGQFPELSKHLMNFGVSVDDTFKLMGEGPEEFIRGLGGIAIQIKKSVGEGPDAAEQYGAAMRRMSGFVEQAVGPRGAQLIERMAQSWDTVGDSMVAQMDAVKGAKVDFGKLADESHSTGRTLQENFDRMKEAGIMGFRAISRSAAVDFVQNTGKAFGQFNAQLKKVAAGDGPMAGIVKQLSLMHQIGAYALIPEALRPMAVLFGEIGGQLLPLIGSIAPIIGPMGAAFVGMGGPMMLITAAAGALVVPLTLLGLRFGQLMLEGKTFSQALDQIGKDIQGFADTAVDKLYNSLMGIWTWMQGVDLGAVFTKMFKGLEAAITGKGSFDLFDWLFGGKKELKKGELSTKQKLQEITEGVPVMFDRVRDAFIGAAKTVDWGGVATGILSGLVYVFIELPNKMFQYAMSADWAGMLKKLIEGVSSSMASSSVDGIGDVLIRALVGVADMVTRSYQVMWKALKTAFELLATVDWSSVGASLWVGLKKAFEGGGNALKGLGEGIWAALKGAFDWVLAKGPEVAAWLTKSIPKWVDMAVGAMKFGESAFTQAQDWVFGLVESLGGYIKVGLEWLWEKVPGWLGSIAEWFAGIDWIGLGGKLLKGIISLWATIQAGIVGLPPTILGWLVNGLTWVLEKIPAAIEKYLPIAMAWIENLPKMVEDMLSGDAGGDAAGGFIGGIFAKFADAVSKYWPVLVGIVTKLIPAIFNIVVKLVGTALPMVASTMLKLLPILYNIFGQIWLKVMDTARDFVVGLVDSIKNYLMAKFPSVAAPIEAVFFGIKLVVLGAFEVFKWFWFAVITGFEYFWTGIGWVLEMIWLGIKTVGDVLVWLGGAAWSALKAVGGAFEWVYDKVSGFFGMIDDWVDDLFRNSIDTDVGACLKKVGAMFKKVSDFIANVVSKVVTSISKGVQNLYQRVIGWFTSIRSTVGSVMSWLTDIWGGVQAAWNTATAGIQTSLDTWVGWFRGIWEEIKNKAGEVGAALMGPWERVSAIMSSFRDKAKDFFQPFIASAISFGKNLVDKFRGIVRSLSQFLLSVYEQIAKVPGVDTVIPKSTVDATVKSLKAMSTAANETSTAVAEIPKTLAEKFPDAYALVRNWQADVTNELTKARNALPFFQQQLDAFNKGMNGKPWDTVATAEFQKLTENVAGTEDLIRRLTAAYSSPEARDAYTKIAEDTDDAAAAMTRMRASIAGLRKEVGLTVGHSIQWDWDAAMNVMNKASEGTTSKLGEFAGKIGDVEGVASAAFAKVGEEAKSLDKLSAEPGILLPATDVMATAITQPFLHGAAAADYYAEASMKAFAKVAYGAEMLQEVMHDLSPIEMLALRMRAAPPVESPAADGMTARQRELQELSQGPMRELLQATHNPQWYSDWRTTFLRAHEELKEELRRLQPTGRSEHANAQARPMPERDILRDYGFNYSRDVGN